MLHNRGISIETDIVSELERIEGEIEAHNRMVETLVWQRSELLTKKEDMEMCELVDCIVENGLTANEALELILQELGKKHTSQ
ncbi:MAG: hypothetical protein FWH57_04440 [Oscillospiraceae bacterium]|nr:hypothetical protein [Oscillospiraceae bacterium]